MCLAKAPDLTKHHEATPTSRHVTPGIKHLLPYHWLLRTFYRVVGHFVQCCVTVHVVTLSFSQWHVRSQRFQARRSGASSSKRKSKPAEHDRTYQKYLDNSSLDISRLERLVAEFLNDMLDLDPRKHLGNKISNLSIPSIPLPLRRIQKDPKGSERRIRLRKI